MTISQRHTIAVHAADARRLHLRARAEQARTGVEEPIADTMARAVTRWLDQAEADETEDGPIATGRRIEEDIGELPATLGLAGKRPCLCLPCRSGGCERGGR